jgi:hypothetical protein
MKLHLKRLHKTDKSTIGELSIDGLFECYTLEDIERTVKIKGITAIPKGTYKVGISMSTRFKKELPILFNVPNFSGVRIHSGNVAENTEGCILVGNTRSVDFIGESRKAFNKLFAKMKLATTITLTID